MSILLEEELGVMDLSTTILSNISCVDSDVQAKGSPECAGVWCADGTRHGCAHDDLMPVNFNCPIFAVAHLAAAPIEHVQFLPLFAIHV